jgi:hypothetical protein
MKLFSLALLLALTTFAAADTIDYSGAGSVSAGTAHVSGRVKAGHTWGILDELIEIDNETTGSISQGDLGSVDVVTGTLKACAQGLCFVGGDLDIRDAAGAVIFKGEFTSGTVSEMGGNTFLNAVLTQGATVLLRDAKGNFSSDSTLTTRVAHTPEPSSLWMLGTGFLGLSLVRRWLQ